VLSSYVRLECYASKAPHVLTSSLADLHVVLEIASCEMDALAVRIARQTLPRGGSSKVRVHIDLVPGKTMLTMIQLTPSNTADLRQ
jgi:hypothetical protein